MQKVEALKTLQALGRYRVVVPHFSEGGCLPYGGNCRDITDCLAERISSSGLVEDVNAEVEDRVELHICNGRNNSHFRNGGHVWAGLARKSRPEDMVVVDGSYQQISFLKSNGYRLSRSDYPSDVRSESQTELAISQIEIFEDGIAVDTPNDRVLGLSTDKSVSFSFGYTAWSLHPSSKYFNDLVAFIRVGHVNSKDAAIFLTNPFTGQISVDYSNEAFVLSNDASQELAKILVAASQIQFTHIEDN